MVLNAWLSSVSHGLFRPRALGGGGGGAHLPTVDSIDERRLGD